MKIDILGVKIDRVTMNEALKIVSGWLKKPGKQYIVTPNPEMIVAAQKDLIFRKILNDADLAIPDSSSFGFSHWLFKKSNITRLLLWPLLLLPLKQVIQFERVSGTDLMEALCRIAAEKGFTTGFLGGRDEVAKRCAERLRKKYLGLKVVFVSSGGNIDNNGREAFSENSERLRQPDKSDNQTIRNSDTLILRSSDTPSSSESFRIPPVDILFVALGHIKQEKWIARNLPNLPVKVAMGVGGAFDYLSGSVPRAPEWIRNLGFEWLFRLIVQPWRTQRQLLLLKYLWLIVIK